VIVFFLFGAIARRRGQPVADLNVRHGISRWIGDKNPVVRN